LPICCPQIGDHATAHSFLFEASCGNNGRLSRKTPDAALLAPRCHCSALCRGSSRFGSSHSASSFHRTWRKPNAEVEVSKATLKSRHQVRSRPRQVPTWVARKISELSRSSLEIVIPITQAMLDDRSIEDAPTSKMMPYRPLTPCNARLKVRPSRKPAFTNVT